MVVFVINIGNNNQYKLNLKDFESSSLGSLESLINSGVLAGDEHRNDVLEKFWYMYLEFNNNMDTLYAEYQEEQNNRTIMPNHGLGITGISGDSLPMVEVTPNPIIKETPLIYPIGNDGDQVTYMGLVKDDNGHWVPKEN